MRLSDLSPEQQDMARQLVQVHNSGTYSQFGQILPRRDVQSLFGTDRQVSTKHDFVFDFGYKDELTFKDFHYMWKRNGAANSLVGKTIAKTWQTMPKLRETDDKNAEETGPEKEIRKRFRRIRFWQMLMEADRRSMVGQYAAVIFQLADNRAFDQPVGNVRGGLNGLINVIPAWEGQLFISKWEQDEKSPNYGKPTMFTYEEGAVDPEEGKQRSFQVHPDRVYIWSQDETTFNDSQLEPVYNSLVDMIKIRGSGAEGFWKNAKTQMILEADKEVNLGQLAAALGVPTEELPDALDKEIAKYSKDFDRTLMLHGMSARSLDVRLPKPKEFYDIASAEAAAAFNIPEKIWFGNQVGERASGEDAASWNRYNMSRRNTYVIPNIMGVTDRLIDWGILHDMDWHLDWQDLTIGSLAEQFDQATKMADINSKQVATDEPAFTNDEIRDVVGMKPQEDIEGDDLDMPSETDEDTEDGETPPDTPEQD